MRPTLRYPVKKIHLCCLSSLSLSLSLTHTHTHTHLKTHAFVFAFQFPALNNLCIASLLALETFIPVTQHVCQFIVLFIVFLYGAHSHKVWPLELLQIQEPLGTTLVLLFFPQIQSKRIQVMRLHNTIYLNAYFESLEDVDVAQKHYDIHSIY